MNGERPAEALGAELSSLAYHSMEGLAAWPVHHIDTVLAAARDHGLAVTALQYWIMSTLGPEGEHPTHYHLIFRGSEEAVVVRWEPETDWDQAAESWREFVDRTAVQAAQWLAANPPETIFPKERWETHLRIHAELRDERDYALE